MTSHGSFCIGVQEYPPPPPSCKTREIEYSTRRLVKKVGYLPQTVQNCVYEYHLKRVDSFCTVLFCEYQLCSRITNSYMQNYSFIFS